MMPLLDEQRRMVAYLDGLQAKVNAFPLAARRLGVDVRELPSTGGAELRRRRTLMPSILDKAFKGEI